MGETCNFHWTTGGSTRQIISVKVIIFCDNLNYYRQLINAAPLDIWKFCDIHRMSEKKII